MLDHKCTWHTQALRYIVQWLHHSLGSHTIATGLPFKQLRALWRRGCLHQSSTAVATALFAAWPPLCLANAGALGHRAVLVRSAHA